MAGGRSGTAGLPPRRAKRGVAANRPEEPASFGLTPRRSAAKMRSEAAQSLQRFVRQSDWNGLAAGDVVRVAGHTPRGRHWRFRAHVTNTSNGAAWVEVALVEGPPPSRRPSPRSSSDVSLESGDTAVREPRVDKIRSFDPALVTPRWRGRGRVASLLRPGGGTAGESVRDEQSQALSEQTSLF
jgi:hypothetical protein